MPEADRADVLWIREWRAGSAVNFRIGRAGESLVAEWVGIAELRAKRSGESPSFTVLNGEAREEQANKIRRGAAEALLRHLRGRLSLHASSAARSGGSILFLGDSDCGKSTTAAQLCRRHGFALLADDIAFLEESVTGFDVAPSEAVHWLCSDAAEFVGGRAGLHFKSGLPATLVATAATQLLVTVKLVFDEAVSRPQAIRLSGERAFLALGPGMLRFAIDDRAADLRDLGLLSRMHAAAPMYEVRRPRSLDVLAETIELVLRLVEKQKEGAIE